MLTVAVTGGMGSGKTTVCDTIRSMRIPVLSADDLSKEIADSSAPVRRQIVALLGPRSYTTDGKLDRAYVASVVFGRPRRLRKLESILHPRVLRSVRSWLRDQERKKRKVAVVEAALVFESGLDKLVDLVVVVDATKKTRIERIRKRDGASLAQIRGRMSAQMGDAERRERADVIIRNDSTRAALRNRTRFLVQVLKKLS